MLFCMRWWGAHLSMSCEGGMEDIAKHIKKKRIQDRKKNGKKGAQLRPGSARQVRPFIARSQFGGHVRADYISIYS